MTALAGREWAKAGRLREAQIAARAGHEDASTGSGKAVGAGSSLTAGRRAKAGEDSQPVGTAADGETPSRTAMLGATSAVGTEQLEAEAVCEPICRAAGQGGMWTKGNEAPTVATAAHETPAAGLGTESEDGNQPVGAAIGAELPRRKAGQ